MKFLGLSHGKKHFESLTFSKGIELNHNDIIFTAKILVLCRIIILSTKLFLEGAQSRMALQPINPLIELNYITVLENQQLKQKQNSKKC